MPQDLSTVASNLVAEEKGILAADESTGTLTKRFEKLGIESTADQRRAYRETLFTTPGLPQWISGVILYDETLRQQSSTGPTLGEVLSNQGILVGIKVDTGAKPLAGSPGETVTEGLDGLRDRIAEYVSLGATFAKWRAVITIGDGMPTLAAIRANAHALARYAALCQEGGLVPIVEPEVLMDGDHPLEACFAATEMTQREVFDALAEQHVNLEEMVLKPNMVVAGKGCAQQGSVEQVAEETLRCLRRTVPAAVPGVAFLSGGQSPELATEHLQAMNSLGGPTPWQLSFSYGRALQDPALVAWKGDASNVEAAQAALAHRCRLNSAARSGRYSRELEQT